MIIRKPNIRKMKKILPVIILLIMSINLMSQVQSSCERTWYFDALYKRDVAYLTLLRLREINSPDTNQIYMPYQYQDSIWKGISAIFNAESIPERDSVFKIYCVHNNPVYGTPLAPRVTVILDTSYNWTNNWLNSNMITDYTELNNFINEYEYRIFSASPNSNRVVIESLKPINPSPIADSLIAFEGIVDAYSEVFISNGESIEYDIIGDEQYYKFSLAWGDCLSGCIYHHTWSFKVNLSECSVEYLGLQSNKDDSFPEPKNCEITSISIPKDETCTIFPNPAFNEITVVGEEINYLSIYDLKGNLIIDQKNIGNKLVVNVSDLTSGIYVIKIYTDNSLIVKKIVKQ